MVGFKNSPEIYSRFLELQGSTKPSGMSVEEAEQLKDRYGDRTLLETLNDVVTGKDDLRLGYQE